MESDARSTGVQNMIFFALTSTGPLEGVKTLRLFMLEFQPFPRGQVDVNVSEKHVRSLLLHRVMFLLVIM